jgi:hypothetical protein
MISIIKRKDSDRNDHYGSHRTGEERIIFSVRVKYKERMEKVPYRLVFLLNPFTHQKLYQGFVPMVE